eukprot:SAG31_NODE_20925_length_562_cov_0.771058_1_plen_88_part_10
MRHRSGILRAHDQLNGVAMYTGNGGPRDPLSPAPSATVFVATTVQVGHSAKHLLTATDYADAGIARTAPLHTKARLSISHGPVLVETV